MSLSQALNQFAQNLGRYQGRIQRWELAFTLLDKLVDIMRTMQMKLGISIHPS